MVRLLSSTSMTAKPFSVSLNALRARLRFILPTRVCTLRTIRQVALTLSLPVST
nr:MAG TPA: hypothetical protein [Herelleviridae sp.]